MTRGLLRITLPSPKAAMNIITAMPRATPRRQGIPRSTPTCAPVAVRSTLLGPGVPAAATEKTRKARAWSRVNATYRHLAEYTRRMASRVGKPVSYRYSLLRRLDFARSQLGGRMPLAELALTAGFADQAHFTRMFRAAFGVTPGCYARLCHAARGRPSRRAERAGTTRTR
jgi:AraC-like DNA-binding protein